jgi:hypothetical protein
MQEMELEVQKTENRRCELWLARAKVCMSIPSPIQSTHSLIDRTCKGPYRTPPRRNLSPAGPATVLARLSLAQHILAPIPTLHTHHWGVGAEPRIVTATNGNESAKMIGHFLSHEAQVCRRGRHQSLFLIEKKSLIWSARRRFIALLEALLRPEHGYGAHDTPLRCHGC